MRERKNKIYEYVICLRKNLNKSYFSLVLDVDGDAIRWDFTGSVSLNPSKSNSLKYVGKCLNSSKEGLVIDENGEKEAVMLWDKGEFEFSISDTQLSDMATGVKVGYLKVNLHGKKVKGAFTITAHQIGSEKWNLTKEKDRFATMSSFAFSNYSVVSDLTIEQVRDRAEQTKRYIKFEKNKVEKLVTDPRTLLINNAVMDRRPVFETIFQRMSLGFKLHGLDHATFPQIDVLKKDVLAYYYMASKAMLPFVKDHPVHMIRYSNGVDKKPIFDTSFVKTKPQWVTSLPIYGENNEKVKELVLCQDSKTLLYLQNYNIVENSVWSASLQSASRPMFYVLAIQPHKISIKEYRQNLEAIKDILDSMKLNSFIKTSGIGWQMEVYINFNHRYNFNEFAPFKSELARKIREKASCQLVFDEEPQDKDDKYIRVSTRSNHKKGVRYPPYCLRANDRAQVSIPFDWKDLHSIKPQDYTINTVTSEFIKQNKSWDTIFAGGNYLPLKKVA